ncbi:MAG: hypothetical protein JOZ52_03950 [Acidobacteria bacterium]|nr:hypothetical protein [Acidobacteriota bacterium]
MLYRTLLALLLSLSFITTGAARTTLPQDEETNEPAQQKEQLSPEEEREARAIAEEFIERLEKTGDIAPLVKDLYVSDFNSRLRGQTEGFLPLAIKREVARQMSDEDILRAYTASINCMYLTFRLYAAFEKKRAQEKASRRDKDATKDEDEEDAPTIDELIPPSVIKLIQSDPALNAMLEDARQDEREKREAQQKASSSEQADTSSDKSVQTYSPNTAAFDELLPFKNAEDARRYTWLAEQAAQLLRDHLKSLPPGQMPSVKEVMSYLQSNSDADNAAEAKDFINPRPYVLNDEFMGYPTGTHIICADVLMFHMDLTRTPDGHLKVLNVYLMMD